MTRRADEYNKNHLHELPISGFTLLVERWQAEYGLRVDGMMGPQTLASIQSFLRSEEIASERDMKRVFPLVCLPDGRRPRITSGFWTENPDRDGVDGKRHDGVDFMYEWLESDPEMPVGDAGAVFVNGRRRFWIPPTDLFPLARHALAAAKGVVRMPELTKTGFRLWIEHPNRQRTGYFHLQSVLAVEGQAVEAGQPIGIVGHNPNAFDPLHLHFEVSSVDRYAPENPRPWLDSAVYIAA